MDGPAHGSSTHKRTTLVEFAHAITAVEKHFGPLYGIVAHSFGAAASAIAVRKGLTLQRLVLISCPYSLRHVVSGFARFVGIPHRSHEAMYPIIKKKHGCIETELSFTKIGPELHLPVLLIHDENDLYIPFVDGEHVHHLIRYSIFYKTSGLSHMRILQSEEVIEQATTFMGAALLAQFPDKPKEKSLY